MTSIPGPALWRRAPRRAGGIRALGVLAGVLAAASAVNAQPGACPTALREANALYRDGRFDAVERRLDPCLASADVPTPAYRLLALALVRQQRLPEAHDVVVRLLVADPAYAPDDVQDPPVYVSLVRLVGRQLAVNPPAPPTRAPVVVGPLTPRPAVPLPEVARRPASPFYPVRNLRPPEAPSAARRRPGAVAIEAALGVESYDGERRRVGDGALGGFVANGGLNASAGISVQVLRWLSAEVGVRTFRLPALVRDGLSDAESGYPLGPDDVLGFPVTTYATLDPATTGRRVTSAALTLRLDALPTRRVSPYVRAGLGVSARRVNDGLRVGVGPQGALGVEAAAAPRLALFGEATAALVSDGALDAAVFRRNGDLLLGARVGLRFGLTRPR